MSGSELNRHPDLQDPLKDTASNNSPLEIVNAGSWLVDIEASDDDHLGRDDEISLGERDIADGFANGIDVVLLLCGDGDDWGILADRSLHELLDLLVVLLGLLGVLEDDVDFVLQDDHML
jgi:hypothetical protein